MTTKTKQLEITTEVAKTEEVKTFKSKDSNSDLYNRFKEAQKRILASKTFALAQKKYFALVKERVVDRYDKKSFTPSQLGYLSLLIFEKYKLAS